MPAVHVVSNLASAAFQRSESFSRGRPTLAALARARGLNHRRVPITCERNGRLVSQKRWRTMRAQKSDVVIFTIWPRGSNALKSAAALAAIVVAAVVAPYLAPEIAGLLGVTSTGGIAAVTAGTTAVLAAGGSYLVNALIPVASTASGLSTALNASDSASPTYSFSVSSQQNVARLGGSIPELFGRVRVIPDLAATAWWDWVDGFQRLHQTLLVSQGDVEVEAIQCGRTPVSSFEEIETEVVSPGGTVSLFESEVYQAPEVRGILLGAPNDLPEIDDGTYGPFAACAPSSATDRIGIDIAFPRGLFFNEADGSLTAKSAAWRVEAQKVNGAGTPLGGWITVADETFNATAGFANVSTTGTFMGGGYEATTDINSSLTVSYRYTLPASARWQIRVTRTDDKDLTARAGHEVAWAGLRGFLGGGTYGDVTVLAIKITATASVNDQTVRSIAVTGTRKLPIWNGSTWSAPAATRSIAAAAAYILKSTNGGGLADSEFDLARLAELDATWADRGDTFDLYVSQASILWSSLSTALRAGRATPYHQGGIVRFHRDELQTVHRQSFSRENIAAGSFKLSFVMPSPESEADGVEIRYFNEDVWGPAFIRKRKDGEEGDPANPTSQTLDGIVQADQADREADYTIAADRYRRVFADFETELAGMIPSRGDLVLLAHDMPSWGQSSRVLSWTAGELTVGLWGRPDWGDRSGTWFVRVVDAKGVPSAPTAVASIDDEFTITLSSHPLYDDGEPFDFTVGANAEPLPIMIGHAADVPQRAIFLSAVPRQGSRVAVRVNLEDDRVHVN